jgi:hypothetical protein
MFASWKLHVSCSFLIQYDYRVLTRNRNGVDITVDGGMVLSAGRHSKL